MKITEKDFARLSKEEQNFRWAIFLASDGYQKDLSAKELAQLRQNYIVKKKQLKIPFTG
jgi:hypothetical protein